MSIHNLTLYGLSTSYVSPAMVYHFLSPLAQRMWAWARVSLQLLLYDLIIVVPSEEMAYMKYWLTLLLSPVPEYQAQAAWLGITNIQVGRRHGAGVGGRLGRCLDPGDHHAYSSGDGTGEEGRSCACMHDAG